MSLADGEDAHKKKKKSRSFKSLKQRALIYRAELMDYMLMSTTPTFTAQQIVLGSVQTQCRANSRLEEFKLRVTYFQTVWDS